MNGPFLLRHLTSLGALQSFRLPFFAAIFSLLICSSSTAQSTPSLDTAVDAIFNEYNQPGQPGASVVILSHGQVLYKAGYGYADLKRSIPVTTDTAFHLASVGKQMTALALLMLSAEGKLSLGDSVAKYLPQLRGWGSKITVRHLLHHTSGIPDYYEDIEETYPKPSNKQALRYLAELGYLDFRPGKKFSYSNSGYDTLGSLIEKISGKRFGVFMKERVFDPAGMTNSFAFSSAARNNSKHALGYEEKRGKYLLDDTSNLNKLHGSGSIYSTVDDLAKYDQALFAGQLVPLEVLQEAFTSGKLLNGRATKYGFGWEVGTDSDTNQPYYGHSGAWMGFATYYLHYPQLEASIIVLTNCSCSDPESLAFETGKIVAKLRIK